MDRDVEVAALCDGAATLSQQGNRIASLALLWAAVGIAPTHLRAHRNLASALANSGDPDAAAEEYARYIEFMLKGGEYKRAALELVYAKASIGEHASLLKVGREMIPLSAIAESLALPEPVRRETVALAAPQAASRLAAAPVLDAMPPLNILEAARANAAVTPLLRLPLRAVRLATAGAMTALASLTFANLLSIAALAASH